MKKYRGLPKAQIGNPLQGVTRKGNYLWEDNPDINAPYPSVKFSNSGVQLTPELGDMLMEEGSFNYMPGFDKLAARLNPANPIQKGRTSITPVTTSPVAPKKEPWNPYMTLRGATTGLSWLANKADRNRQDQYMYNQMSTLGQMNPANVNDYQPNPYNLYAQKGGSLKKYQQGGFDEAKEFEKQWMNSSIYKNRNVPDDITKQRFDAVDNLKGPNIVTQEYLNGFVPEEYKGIKPLAMYNATKHSVDILPKTRDEVIAHELFHGSTKGNLLIPSSENIDSETRARLQTFRQAAQQEGVIDPFKEEFNKTHLRGMKRSKALGQIKSLFKNDDELLKYLGSTSQTNQQSIPMAQTGGRTPIVVNNPNDPRLKAYNDSLYMHNYGKQEAAFLLNPKTTEKAWKDFHKQASNYRIVKDSNNEKIYGVLDDAEQASRRLAVYNNSKTWDNKNPQYPDKYISEEEKDRAAFSYIDRGSKNRFWEKGWFSDLLGNTTVGTSYQYAKPVQPVVYQQPPSKSQPTYQDSLKLHNLSVKIANKPNGDVSHGRKPIGKFHKNLLAEDALDYVYTPDEIELAKLAKKTGIMPTNYYPGEGGGLYFKKPVGTPKPQDTLKRKVTNVQPIVNNNGESVQITPAPQNTVQLGAIPTLPYRVEYDGTSHKNFLTAEEGEAYMQELQKRPQGIPYGTRGYYEKKQTGGQFGLDDPRKVALNNIARTDNTNIQGIPIQLIASDLQAIKDMGESKKIINAKELVRRKKAISQSNINNTPATSAAGDKLRLFPDDPNSFIDEYLNPLKMVGDMADDIGHNLGNPNSSIGQTALSLATPLAMGAIGSIGAKSTGQFINNTFNPIPLGSKEEFLDIIKTLKNNKLKNVTISKEEQELLNSTRLIGSLSQSLNSNPKTSISILQSLKNKANNLNDDYFEKVTGFKKSEIDDKIKLLTENNSKKQTVNLDDSFDLTQSINNFPRGSRQYEELTEEINRLRAQQNQLADPPNEFIHDISRRHDGQAFLLNSQLRESIRAQGLETRQMSSFLEEYNLYNPNFSNNRNFFRKESLFSKIKNKLDKTEKSTNMPLSESLIPSLAKNAYNNPSREILEAYNKVKTSAKGQSFIPAHSLSSDSYNRLSLPLIERAIKEDIINLNYHGLSPLNLLGFPTKAGIKPELILKEINSKISNINKLTGKKYPFAELDGEQIFYPTFTVTRKKLGGVIKMNKLQDGGQFGLQNPRDIARNMANPNTNNLAKEEAAMEIYRRNKATDKRKFLNPTTANTLLQEEQRRLKNKAYAATSPNVAIDQFGDLSRVNQDRDMEGNADNFMSQRQDKSYEHINNALLAAEGFGAAAIGIKALKPWMRNKLENLSQTMFKPKFNTIVSENGIGKVNPKTGNEYYKLDDAEMLSNDYEPHFTSDQYKKFLKNDKLSNDAKKWLDETGKIDPSDGGFSPRNNPTYNKMKDLLQYGKKPQLNKLDFTTSEELMNEKIFDIEFSKQMKNLSSSDLNIQSQIEEATKKTLNNLRNNTDYSFDIGLKRSLKKLVRGPNTYNKWHKDFRPEFLDSQYPLGSQAKMTMRNPLGMIDDNFDISNKNINVFGDNALIDPKSVLRKEMINIRPEISNRDWKSKALDLYKSQLKQNLDNLNLQNYSGKEAFKKLEPNKLGGLIKKRLRSK